MTEQPQVLAWIKAATAELAKATFAQADIDEIAAAEPESLVMLRTAIRYFLEIVDEVFRLNLDADVMLTIPLPWSTSLSTEHPSITELLTKKWDTLEVPGLYLLRPDHWRAYDQVEEYKVPVRFDFSAAVPPRAYYRTFLPNVNASHQLEYARAIYVRTIESNQGGEFT